MDTDLNTGNAFTDFFKNKAKSIAMSYVTPYLNDIKTAIANRDFNKLANITKVIAGLVGYADVGAQVAAVFADLAAKNYTAAIKDAVAAFETIYAMFPKSAPAPHMTVSATAPEDHVLAMIEGFFAESCKAEPTLTAEQPDGEQPTQFGFVEAAAILSLVWTGIQMLRARREKNKQA